MLSLFAIFICSAEIILALLVGLMALRINSKRTSRGTHLLKFSLLLMSVSWLGAIFRFAYLGDFYREAGFVHLCTISKKVSYCMWIDLRHLMPCLLMSLVVLWIACAKAPDDSADDQK